LAGSRQQPGRSADPRVGGKQRRPIIDRPRCAAAAQTALTKPCSCSAQGFNEHIRSAHHQAVYAALLLLSAIPRELLPARHRHCCAPALLLWHIVTGTCANRDSGFANNPPWRLASRMQTGDGVRVSADALRFLDWSLDCAVRPPWRHSMAWQPGPAGRQSE